MVPNFWVHIVSPRVTFVFYWKGGTNPKRRVFIGHDVSSAPEDAGSFHPRGWWRTLYRIKKMSQIKMISGHHHFRAHTHIYNRMVCVCMYKYMYVYINMYMYTYTYLRCIDFLKKNKCIPIYYINSQYHHICRTFACTHGIWSTNIRGLRFTIWKVPLVQKESPLKPAKLPAFVVIPLRHSPPKKGVSKPIRSKVSQPRKISKIS